MTPFYTGVDVSKETIDGAYWADQKPQTIGQYRNQMAPIYCCC